MSFLVTSANFSGLPNLRNTPSIVAIGAGVVTTSLTMAHTVPASLPSSCQAIMLVCWEENAVGTMGVTFGGNAADQVLVAPGAPGTVTTPVSAAYRWLNPAAGSLNLVLTQATTSPVVPDVRSAVSALWIFDDVAASIFDASYHLESATSALTVPITMTTSAPTYGIALTAAQGNDNGPVGIADGWTELADGVTRVTGSVTTDMTYQAASKVLTTSGAQAPTVTFTTADGRGAVALAIRGR